MLLVLASCNIGTDRTATSDGTATSDKTAATPDIHKLALADYRPVSVYKIPVTRLEKAAYPVIDMHSHDYAKTREEVETWVETLQKCGITKTVILSSETGAGFDAVVEEYSAYPSFELWCGIDYTGYDTDPNWINHAIKELERCHDLGAKGVGELGDKGEGLWFSTPTAAYGLHVDDPSLEPLWKRCAELGMPVNIHVADPIWMYLPMDSTNDGLMNAWEWRIDLSKENILNHRELIGTLENLVARNPQTKFVACHFANCSYDLEILAGMFDKYPNLWADISARYAETAPIPRHVKAFYEKYPGRLLYGTDMGMEESMYMVTFRILESEDEHFYENDLFGYHWPLNGFGLSGEVLEQVYNTNAVKLYNSL